MLLYGKGAGNRKELRNETSLYLEMTDLVEPVNNQKRQDVSDSQYLSTPCLGFSSARQTGIYRFPVLIN